MNVKKQYKSDIFVHNRPFWNFSDFLWNSSFFSLLPISFKIGNFPPEKPREFRKKYDTFRVFKQIFFYIRVCFNFIKLSGNIGEQTQTVVTWSPSIAIQLYT